MSSLTNSLLRAALESDDALGQDPVLDGPVNEVDAVLDVEEQVSAMELTQGVDALDTLSAAEQQLSALKTDIDAQPEVSQETYGYLCKAVDAIIAPLGVRRPTESLRLVDPVALENNSERLTVSTEGLGSFLKSILDAIVRAIKAVWNFFFDHLGKSSRRAHNKLETVRAYRVAFEKAIGAVPSVSKIERPKSFHLISADHHALLTQGDFARYSKQHYETLRTLQGTYLETLSGAITEIERVFTGDLQKPYDEKRGREMLDRCNKAAEVMRGDRLIRMFSAIKPVMRDGVLGRGYLLGNRELEIEQGELAPALTNQKSPHLLAKAIQSLQLRISADELDFNDATIPALDARSMAKIMTDMEVILAEVTSTEVERKALRLQKTTENLERIGRAAGEKLERSEVTDAQYAPYASTIRYYHSVAKWGVTPVAQMRSLTLMVADAVLNLAAAHAKNLDVKVSKD